jgi:hypothetical protein
VIASNRHTPQVQIVDITPEMAESWLAANVHNRKLREKVVRLYAADMADGAWRFTGDAIRFDTSGNLLDGQHRLHAIVRSGATVKALVVCGLEPEAQEDIDTGAKRSLADVLSLRGEMNAVNLATIIRHAYEWNDRGRASARQGSVATHHQLLKFLDDHPELREITVLANNWRKHIDMPASVIGVVFWVISSIDDDSHSDAVSFFDRLASGQGLFARQPIYELRRVLEQASKATAATSHRAGPVWLSAVTIKAWNAYRRGDEIGVLRFRAGGADPESFPKPI